MGGLDVAGPRLNAELINTVWDFHMLIHQCSLFLICYREACIDLCSHQSVPVKHTCGRSTQHTVEIKVLLLLV